MSKQITLDTIDRLKTEAQGYLAKAKDLMNEYQEKDLPEDVSNQIDGLLGKADEIKARIQTWQQVQDNEAFFETAPKTSNVSWREAGPNEGDVQVDEKSWRELEIKTLMVHPELGIMPIEKTIRYYVPLKVQEAGKMYPELFNEYVRGKIHNLSPEDQKTLRLGLDSAGGFLAPPDMQAEIIKKTATMATVRPNARVVQTSRDVAEWPKISYTTDNQYTSGVRLTWTGEVPSSSTVHRVTDPVFGIERIPVNTAMASIPISLNMVEDSAFDIIGISSELLGEAFALGENNVFWNGTGVNQPFGILYSIDTDGPASVASTTASTLTATGLMNLWGALPSQYEMGAKWYMAKSTELIIRKLVDGNNNYLWPVWPQVGGFGPAPRELLGFPTVRDEFIPAVSANAYPIVFGDLRGYIIADRVGLSIQRLDEAYAESNAVVLLARKRVGGKVVEPYKIKVQKVSAS